MGSARKMLMLNEEDRKKLKSIINSRTEPFARVQRARIMLAYAMNEPITSITQKENVSRPVVELCIDKALAGGIEAGLMDLPRQGRPPEISIEAKTWVISLACSKPTDYGFAAERWTLEQLANYVRSQATTAGFPRLASVKKGQIHRILEEPPIKPHKTGYYLERKDPDFEVKMAQILVVYKEIQQINHEFRLNPQTERNSTTVSYDEKPGIQAIANIAPDLPPVPGKYSTWSRDYEYKRLGTVSLLAGIDLHDGRIIALVKEQHRSLEFIEFLGLLNQSYPENWRIRVILDNHSVHISKETMQWLKQYPQRFEFIFTPKHGSWLNLIEVFFSKMTRSFLRSIRVKSVDELIQRTYKYFDEINAAPVIFKWKYKLDETIV